MRRRYLYQTLDNRSNAEEIQKHGPYECNRDDAWLGRGYYFWDSSIEAAHWWGKMKDDGYIICESQYNYDSLEYLDLVGNTEHLKKIKDIATIIKDETKQSVTVPMAIEQMKIYTDFSKQYKAIRAYPIKSRKNEEDKIYFIDKNVSYINLDPPIQMCVLDKSFLIDNIFEVIHIEKHNKDHLV